VTPRMREIGKGVGATGALLLLVAGPPLLLAAGVGWPLPREVPTWSEVGDALSGATVSDTALVNALSIACWIVWLLVIASIVEELAAWGRGRSARRLPGGGSVQPLIRQLVMTATLLVTAARSSSEPSTLPPTIPAVAVTQSAEHEALVQASMAPTLPTCLVQPRDSLWKLAEDHLGDGMRWREVWHLNRDRVQVDGRTFTDPNLIHPGWELFMPSDATGLGTSAPAGDSPPPPAVRPTAPEAVPPTTTPTRPPDPVPTSLPETRPDKGSEGPDLETSAADDPDFDVVPLLAGAALVAAGIVASVDQLRRRQLRYRRSIQLPGPSERRAEVSLRRAADPDGYSRLDLALRNLSHQLGAAGGDEHPRVDVVSVGPSGIEILLDRPTDAPAGPFDVAASGRAWTLPAGIADEVLAAVAHDEPGLVPALAAVGSVDDRTVLVDLESSPCTVLNGDPSDASALLWTIAVDLATSNRADDIELLVVGQVPAGLEALDRVRRIDRLTDVLNQLELQVRSTQQLLAPDGHQDAFEARLAGHGDGMAPTVVVMDAQGAPDDDIGRLVDLARRRAGVAVVLTGDVDSPERELCVEDDTLIVKPLGLRLRPAALPEDLIPTIAGLVTTAADVEGDTPPDSIDLREPTPAPDPLVEYDSDGRPTIADGHVLVRVFGGVEVVGGDRPIDRRRCIELVVFLALHPDGVDEERLREALWPENNPSRSAFNETVSRARRCLGLDPSGLPHVRHMKHGLYQLGPYVHVEPSPAPGLVPFQGCRGYEWAYTEGIAYTLEAPLESDRSA
jgi:hypothetical protein